VAFFLTNEKDYLNTYYKVIICKARLISLLIVLKKNLKQPKQVCWHRSFVWFYNCLFYMTSTIQLVIYVRSWSSN